MSLVHGVIQECGHRLDVTNVSSVHALSEATQLDVAFILHSGDCGIVFHGR